MINNMKRTLFLLSACATLILAACQREPRPAETVPEGLPAEVTVRIDNAWTTRATDINYADESKVNTLQVFVFKGDDREAYRSVSQSLQASVPATSGERTVWAVVNAPDLSDIMTLSALKDTETSLADNTLGSFVMTGSVIQELVDGGNVPITVKRIVARVSLNKVSASLKDYRKDYSVRIEKLFLINVAAGNRYDVGGAPTTWENKAGHNDEVNDALLYEALDNVIIRNNVYKKNGAPVDENDAYDDSTHAIAEGVTVTKDNSYTKEHVFYTYPNPFPRSESPDTYTPEWSPRGTLLVLEARMFQGASDAEGIHGYYPIILPPLERNKAYIIEEVRITRLPGSEPFKPIETGEAQVSITVCNWEIVLVNGGYVTI